MRVPKAVADVLLRRKLYNCYEIHDAVRFNTQRVTIHSAMVVRATVPPHKKCECICIGKGYGTYTTTLLNIANNSHLWSQMQTKWQAMDSYHCTLLELSREEHVFALHVASGSIMYWHCFYTLQREHVTGYLGIYEPVYWRDHVKIRLNENHIICKA
jgi:hypothetical protein